MLNEKYSKKELSLKTDLKQKIEVLKKELILKAINSKNCEMTRIARKFGVPD